jgi:hypothetical protein
VVSVCSSVLVFFLNNGCLCVCSHHTDSTALASPLFTTSPALRRRAAVGDNNVALTHHAMVMAPFFLWLCAHVNISTLERTALASVVDSPWSLLYPAGPWHLPDDWLSKLPVRLAAEGLSLVATFLQLFERAMLLTHFDSAAGVACNVLTLPLLPNASALSSALAVLPAALFSLTSVPSTSATIPFGAYPVAVRYTQPWLAALSDFPVHQSRLSVSALLPRSIDAVGESRAASDENLASAAASTPLPSISSALSIALPRRLATNDSLLSSAAAVAGSALSPVPAAIPLLPVLINLSSALTVLRAFTASCWHVRGVRAADAVPPLPWDAADDLHVCVSADSVSDLDGTDSDTDLMHLHQPLPERDPSSLPRRQLPTRQRETPRFRKIETPSVPTLPPGFDESVEEGMPDDTTANDPEEMLTASSRLPRPPRVQSKDADGIPRVSLAAARHAIAYVHDWITRYDDDDGI